MLLPKKYNLIQVFVAVFILLACTPKGNWVTKIQSTFSNGDTKTAYKYLVSNSSDTLQIQFIEYHDNGALKIKGEFDLNNKRHGTWEAFYPDSTKWSVGSYIHGVQEGKKTVWYANGQKRFEGVYKDGKESGAWKFWDEQGKLVKTVNRD